MINLEQAAARGMYDKKVCHECQKSMRRRNWIRVIGKNQAREEDGFSQIWGSQFVPCHILLTSIAELTSDRRVSPVLHPLHYCLAI